jgi:hypothetical protein
LIVFMSLFSLCEADLSNLSRVPKDQSALGAGSSPTVSQ